MTPGGPDAHVLRRHLLALDDALNRLEAHAQVSPETYLADGDLQWLVERGLLVATQNVLDICAHLAAAAGRDAPDYASAIDAMGVLSICPAELSREMRPMAGFRNVLVHGYLTVDPRRVHGVLTTKLGQLRDFAQHVERHLESST